MTCWDDTLYKFVTFQHACTLTWTWLVADLLTYLESVYLG